MEKKQRLREHKKKGENRTPVSLVNRDAVGRRSNGQSHQQAGETRGRQPGLAISDRRSESVDGGAERPAPNVDEIMRLAEGEAGHQKMRAVVGLQKTLAGNGGKN